jgi:gluconolactonase
VSLQVLAEGLRYPEGPTFDREGNLYVVEIAGGSLRKIAPDGTVSLFVEQGGGPNGMAVGPDGNFYVCNTGGRATPGNARIERVTPGGEVASILTEVDGERLHAPNDISFDSQGNFYFTDPIFPQGSVLEDLAPPAGVCFGGLTGEVHRLMLGLHIPNGVAISPDESTLVVCETQTNKVHGYEITEPGVLGESRVYGDLGENALPDGMCFDEEGYLLVCGAQSGRVHIFPPGGGDQVNEIEVDNSGVTNLCFGGPDFRSLFITEGVAGRVVTMEWERPGMRLFPDRT